MFQKRVYSMINSLMESIAALTSKYTHLKTLNTIFSKLKNKTFALYTHKASYSHILIMRDVKYAVNYFGKISKLCLPVTMP